MSENTTFREIKLVSSAIPRFCVILTGEFNSNTTLMIQGHTFEGQSQGQTVNLKVKITKKKI